MAGSHYIFKASLPSGNLSVNKCDFLSMTTMLTLAHRHRLECQLLADSNSKSMGDRSNVDYPIRYTPCSVVYELQISNFQAFFCVKIKNYCKIFQTALFEIMLGSSRKSKFDYIDLFAGIGGLRRGFDAIGGECVFTSEWNKFSQQTYRANFSDNHDIAGDIRDIDEAEIPEHDVLLAGFPCQPFSIAGVSKRNALKIPHGFSCDTQGTLFFDIARIISYHQPRVLLLENVKNLVNHDKGRTFKLIRDVLTNDLGYNISWRVINAKSWVPQNRQRIFIVGMRDRNDFSLDDFEVPDPLRGPKLEEILHPEDGTEAAERPYTTGRDAKVARKYILSKHLWQYLRDYAERHRRQGNGFGYGLVGPTDIARTMSARYYKDGAEILIKRGRGRPRRLTPRECARLMGFDQPNESKFIIPVSDGQAYRQFGNAVVATVVDDLAKFMVPWIVTEKDTHQFTELKRVA